MHVVTIKIKRFDKTLPLPMRQSKGAVCYDLCARVDTTIKARTFGFIPLNIATKLPDDYWVHVSARSSTHKLGLIMSNGIGVVDQDYCGNEDEYKFPVYNVTKQDVTINRGIRIAQMMVLPRIDINLQEVDKLENINRGGFGSTGSN